MHAAELNTVSCNCDTARAICHASSQSSATGHSAQLQIGVCTERAQDRRLRPPSWWYRTPRPVRSETRNFRQLMGVLRKPPGDPNLAKNSSQAGRTPPENILRNSGTGGKGPILHVNLWPGILSHSFGSYLCFCGRNLLTTNLQHNTVTVTSRHSSDPNVYL